MNRLRSMSSPATRSWAARISCGITLACLLTLVPGSAADDHTAFIYHGTLEPGTIAAPHLDMLFSIYSQPDGGRPLWQSEIFQEVSLDHGSFTVTLDPGSRELYRQAPLYLQIAVRPADSDGTFTPLDHRPPITYTPLGVKTSKFRGKSLTDKIWIAIGLFGQLFFTARFLVQWIASERAKKSVVPDSFWIFSITGCTIVLLYAFYRQDPVFILAYLFNNLIYIRNLIFIHRQKKLESQPAGAS